ncbi:MAG TPA: Rieske 2Fe-2S domain-containing protein [Polyangia bacterium]|nr:Rieske 2Fe-2S domain-containing protein [Polyangia bacterium]
MTFKPALREEELWIGEMAGVKIEGRPVLLVNVEGTVCAYEDRCRHRALPLSLGRLQGNRLVCAAHEWEYDGCTGRGINPGGVALRRYGVQIADGEIRVDVSDEEGGDV